jgi:hypothetical protein
MPKEILCMLCYGSVEVKIAQKILFMAYADRFYCEIKG